MQRLAEVVIEEPPHEEVTCELVIPPPRVAEVKKKRRIIPLLDEEDNDSDEDSVIDKFVKKDPVALTLEKIVPGNVGFSMKTQKHVTDFFAIEEEKKHIHFQLTQQKRRNQYNKISAEARAQATENKEEISQRMHDYKIKQQNQRRKKWDEQKELRIKRQQEAEKKQQAFDKEVDRMFNAVYKPHIKKMSKRGGKWPSDKLKGLKAGLQTQFPAKQSELTKAEQREVKKAKDYMTTGELKNYQKKKDELEQVDHIKFVPSDDKEQLADRYFVANRLNEGEKRDQEAPERVNPRWIEHNFNAHYIALLK